MSCCWLVSASAGTVTVKVLVCSLPAGTSLFSTPEPLAFQPAGSRRSIRGLARVRLCGARRCAVTSTVAPGARSNRSVVRYSSLPLGRPPVAGGSTEPRRIASGEVSAGSYGTRLSIRV